MIIVTEKYAKEKLEKQNIFKQYVNNTFDYISI